MHDFVTAGAVHLDANLVTYMTPEVLYSAAGVFFVIAFAATFLLRRARKPSTPKLVETPSTTVRAAPVSRKPVAPEAVGAAKDKLAEHLKQAVGNASKRMTIVENGEKLTVRVSVANNYEWTRQKLPGMTFAEVSKLVPSTYEGVPVELVFQDPNA